jgi:hypothetical protein
MSGNWNNIQLAIHCAYHQEALALISALRLKRDNDVHAFALFSNEETVLIESGQGAQQTAAAIGFIAGRLPHHHAIAWLNLGIAGHANADIGRLFIAQRILDTQSQHCHYPDRSLKLGIDAETVCSYPDINHDYQQTALYDVEAWAFFASALNFSSVELIQCLKVVSDNRSSPVAVLDKQTVPKLFQPHINAILEVIEQLRERALQLRQIEQLPALYQQLLGTTRFSESQKTQLQHLLRQWQQIGAPDIDQFTLAHLSNKHCAQQARAARDLTSRQFLQGLEQALLQHYKTHYR